MLNAESGSVESHVDRAKRGPTSENPSLSLKKRLKRAHFLDQRDRQVAEGVAEPVDASAGLPEAVADKGLFAHWSGASDPEHRAQG